MYVSRSLEILYVISLMCYQYGNIGYLWGLAVWPSAFDGSGPFPTRRKKESLSDQCSLALLSVLTPLCVLVPSPGPAFSPRGHGYSLLSSPRLVSLELGLISKYG